MLIIHGDHDEWIASVLLHLYDVLQLQFYLWMVHICNWFSPNIISHLIIFVLLSVKFAKKPHTSRKIRKCLAQSWQVDRQLSGVGGAERQLATQPARADMLYHLTCTSIDAVFSELFSFFHLSYIPIIIIITITTSTTVVELCSSTSNSKSSKTSASSSDILIRYLAFEWRLYTYNACRRELCESLRIALSLMCPTSYVTNRTSQ